jgi:hypothetical protein
LRGRRHHFAHRTGRALQIVKAEHQASRMSGLDRSMSGSANLWATGTALQVIASDSGAGVKTERPSAGLGRNKDPFTS